MSAILLIGDDAFLLQTRGAVLRATGAEIVSSDTSSALHFLEKRFFDVVILCHSIPLHVCQTIAAVIQQNWPGTRLLQVSAVREWEELECARGIEVCSPEPERLIERTSMLLNHRNCDSVRPVIQKPSDRTITVH